VLDDDGEQDEKKEHPTNFEKVNTACPEVPN
jgi:hypothetical protein